MQEIVNGRVYENRPKIQQKAQFLKKRMREGWKKSISNLDSEKYKARKVFDIDE